MALATAIQTAFNSGQSSDPATVGSGAAQLSSAVSAAHSFPPIPDAQAQQSWSEALQFAAEAVAQYQAFVQDPGLGFVDPLAHVSVLQSITALSAADRRITAVTR